MRNFAAFVKNKTHIIDRIAGTSGFTGTCNIAIFSVFLLGTCMDLFYHALYNGRHELSKGIIKVVSRQ